MILAEKESRNLVASAHRLRTRVLDSGLRTAIGDFNFLCARATTGLDGVEPDKAVRQLQRRDEAEAVNKYVELAERIGENLRIELDRRILAGGIERP